MTHDKTQFLLEKKSFLIKIIAITTMIIDHVGFLFFPYAFWLRIIGRVSFPLFGWLIAQGFEKTSNRSRYLFRIFIFAIISQMPYHLFFPHSGLNIFFTLLFALSILWVQENKFLKSLKKIFYITLLVITSCILPIDYQIFGVLSIILFYYYKNSFISLFISQGLVWTGFIIFNSVTILPITLFKINQLFALCAVCIILIFSRIPFKNNYYTLSLRTKKIIQYGLYIFYPAHLLILYLIHMIITK